MRGRGGYYEESKKTDANGEKALVTALSEKDIALAQGANGSKPITFSEQPDDVLVDRVSRTVKIDAGAAGYAAAADQIAQYSKQEEAQNEKKESSLPGLEVKGEKIDQGLIQNKSANVAVENEENRLSQELYDQNLKIGVQEEIGQRLKKDESQVLALQKELSWWDGYIQKLRKSVPENNGSGVQGPSVRHQIAAPENPLRIVWSKIILALVSVLSFFPTLFKRKKTRRNDI